MALRPSSAAPGLGALVLLAILIALLVGGDDGEEDESGGGGEPQAERGAGDELAGPGRGGDGGGREGLGPSADAPLVPVVDVVDGDTIEVLFEGEEEDVRYIGVDTPESVAPGQPVECFGLEASEFNKELVGGEQVRLVFDAEERDRFGRLLAYVYLGKRFVNAVLVRRGFAQTLTISPNDSFAELFDRLEQAAGRTGRGLWAACEP